MSVPLPAVKLSSAASAQITGPAPNVAPASGFPAIVDEQSKVTNAADSEAVAHPWSDEGTNAVEFAGKTGIVAASTGTDSTNTSDDATMWAVELTKVLDGVCGAASSVNRSCKLFEGDGDAACMPSNPSAASSFMAAVTSAVSFDLDLFFFSFDFFLFFSFTISTFTTSVCSVVGGGMDAAKFCSTITISKKQGRLLALQWMQLRAKAAIPAAVGRGHCAFGSNMFCTRSLALSISGLTVSNKKIHSSLPSAAGVAGNWPVNNSSKTMPAA
mmetsp:Transcript_71536/g.180533  ORF Transcript_71536/g.180533 Transcript_71536/m.180533 type:complete len:271 (-) Transcript_71536:27-839(-)